MKFDDKIRKFTKIVATIGPASDSKETLKYLINEGMDVARLNFSHGNYDYFLDVINKIREIDERIAIMLDTKGPEIRTGCVGQGDVVLKTGDQVLFVNQECECDNTKIFIDYDRLMDVEIGCSILIDDGLIEFEVIDKTQEGLLVVVINSGTLGSNKTVCFQGHNVQIPFLSERDREDILFGLKNNLSFVAASFVRRKEDIVELREFINKHNPFVKIISKIEHWDAVNNIDEIIEVSDGIMIARGDLGVEINIEKVPQVQKEIIEKCNIVGKPVIVATQMLESMKENPRPTRAEVADVANAILQGTDAIMLSGETASGRYPIQAVKMFVKIAREYDLKVKSKLHLYFNETPKKLKVCEFVTNAAYLAYKTLHLKAILTPTESGATARGVSRFKPKCLILASTPNLIVARELQLSWGVIPFCEPQKFDKLTLMINSLVVESHKKGFLEPEDYVVITAGHKIAQIGSTNLLMVHEVKEILGRVE